MRVRACTSACLSAKPNAEGSVDYVLSARFYLNASKRQKPSSYINIIIQYYSCIDRRYSDACMHAFL